MVAKKSILVVEDHESLRMLLSAMLAKDYQVVAKRDGLEALAWLGSGHLPDLIILDMEMPRVDGQEFLANLRSSGFFQSLPVIILSGSHSNDLEQCQALGIQGVLRKPFNPVDLRKTILQVFEASATQTAA